MATRSEILLPPAPPRPIVWLRQNLFSSPFNSLLTVLSLAFIIWILNAALRWVLLQADWSIVFNHPLLYAVGQYPREALWRVGINLTLLSLLIGASWGCLGRALRLFSLLYAAMLAVGILWPAQFETLTLIMRLALAANIGVMGLGYLAGRRPFVTGRRLVLSWLAALAIALVLLSGIPGAPLLPLVPTGLWGGLMVTLILAVGGIVLSFPFGVLLALGRRSSLPVVSIFSTIFIEIVRGVPLIGILFLASLILPLFFPPDVRFDRLLRALAGLTVFSAAYTAENVRGGLAAVPRGQEEAAMALGLNRYQVLTLIVLPQALRIVIPPIMGQFVSLFKDTTLVSGIAVLELLAVGRSVLGANPEYVDQQAEMLLFVAAVFWFFSYLMSYASQRLETALGVGER